MPVRLKAGSELHAAMKYRGCTRYRAVHHYGFFEPTKHLYIWRPSGRGRVFARPQNMFTVFVDEDDVIQALTIYDAARRHFNLPISENTKRRWSSTTLLVAKENPEVMEKADYRGPIIGFGLVPTFVPRAQLEDMCAWLFKKKISPVSG